MASCLMISDTPRVRRAPLWPTAAAAWAASTITLLTAVLISLPVSAQNAGTLAPQDIEQFLLTAEIVHARPIDKGVTKPWRLTLSDGRITHDAARLGRKSSRGFYRYRNGKRGGVDSTGARWSDRKCTRRLAP